MNRKNLTPLAMRILALLGQGTPLKAKTIAAKLQVEPTEINSELYGTLSSLVEKDAAYIWSLNSESNPVDTELQSQGIVSETEVVNKDNNSQACPECGRAMELKMARRGPNRGNQFWGCTGWPNCRGLISLSGVEDSTAEKQGAKKSLPVAVDWREGKGRAQWSAEYLQVGFGSPLFSETVNASSSATRLLSQTVILRSRDRAAIRPDGLTLGLTAVAEKILLRGNLPLGSIAVEGESLQTHGLQNDTENVSGGGSSLGWEWRAQPLPWSDEPLLERGGFSGCDEITTGIGTQWAILDSELEQRFFDLVAETDKSLPHWLFPQVPIENLVHDVGEIGADERRIDFLFCHPHLAKPLVIEIDGPEHVKDVDDARDRVLERSGCEIIRVQNSEIENSEGPGLEKVLQKLHSVCLHEIDTNSPAWRAGQFSKECAWGGKLQFAVLRAIQEGLLDSNMERWHLLVETPFNSSVAAIGDLLDLLESIEKLFGGQLLPADVFIVTDSEVKAHFQNSDLGWIQLPIDVSASYSTPDVAIRLEPDSSPWAAYPDHPVDLVVRPTFLPRRFAPSHATGMRDRLVTTLDFETARPYLRKILHTIFRKQEFWEGQAEAIYNALDGADSIVLLPTGGGKSIIYQLSGLLSPGITLVIDPLVSLIEDQVRGLKAYGIDRAIGISSATGSSDERRRLLAAAERGEFIFILVSPERMQSPGFRKTLRAIAHSTRINLAVIDEAHCVSEWGHDFRPAYLNLARNLRRIGESDGFPPTLLALTGTASRAVLRDMVADLELDSQVKSSIIRPTSFDRQELSFRIVQCEGRTAEADLRGVLISLPSTFGRPQGEFYTPAGRHTYCGVVFTSFAKGDSGVVNLRKQVKGATNSKAVVYSGGPPLKNMNSHLWNDEKRENARQFMANEVPILVATKAFGMGIDKPNIRYTIHYGMPGSLEAFYQEAGRAGRDRRASQCVILFTQPAPQLEENLDVIRQTLPDLRAAFNAAPRYGRGDLGSALFFHLNAFKGPEEEVGAVEAMLDRLESLNDGQNLEIPFANDTFEKKEEEKALFRLVQVGYLADYEVDYGSHRYLLVGGLRDPNEMADSVLAYVRRSNVGRIQDIQRQLGTCCEIQDVTKATKAIISVLIKYCYDTIERARRRSIFEAMEAAKQGSDPTNFRKRLLDYLQEGMDAESFQRLIEAESIDFKVCLDLLDKVHNAAEAGELRGITIRFLESYPEHPILLALRALSESMTDDCEDSVVLDSFRTLFESGISKYTVGRSEVDELVSIIANIAEARVPRVFPSLLLAIAESDNDSICSGAKAEEITERGIDAATEDVGDVLLYLRYKNSVEQLQKLVKESQFTEEWERG